MSETGNTMMEKMKSVLHKEVKSKQEIQGGTWDSKANTYTTTDEASGVRTVYKVKQNKNVDTGYSVRVAHYKDVTDALGATVNVEVKFDDKKQEWIRKPKVQQTFESMNPRPKFMGTLTENRQPDGVISHSLTVEPVKFKPRQVFIPVRV